MFNDMNNSKALSFFKETAFDRKTINTAQSPRYAPAHLFKQYPNARKIKLPRSSWNLSEARIIQLLQRRRSLRKFSKTPLTLTDLSFILWAAQGITAKAGEHFFRTTPSAGALYPIETYLSIQNVENLTNGLYHFDIISFQLNLLSEHDVSKKIATVFLDQKFMESAALTLIWTAVARRTMSKYGERGGRYLLLDAAHICQNTLLAAEALNCGGCPVAAFYDQELVEILGIDGEEEIPLYGSTIGRKSSE